MKKSLILAFSTFLLTMPLSAQNDKKSDEYVIKPDSFSIKSEEVAPEQIISKGKHSYEPLILINGQVSNTGLNWMDPKYIESITVLKDSEAIKSYGDAGRKGVILVKIDNKISLNQKQPNSKAKLSFEPLFIVNGKVSSTGLNFINPQEIKSITVLNDQRSINSYGEAGKNGVIMVTTNYNIKPEK